MELPKEVELADGRKLSLREVGPAEMLDLIEAAGSAASSSTWMSYALMICSVDAIDGRPIMMPNTKDAVRDLGRRIGTGGMEALTRLHYPEGDISQDEEIDQAKN